MAECENGKEPDYSDTPTYGVYRYAPGFLRVHSSGGGGFGDPLSRSPALVARDVADEVVSIECARSQYGVVINPDGAIDQQQTAQLRASMRS